MSGSAKSVTFKIPMKLPSYNQWTNVHWAKRKRMKDEWEQYFFALLVQRNVKDELQPPIRIDIVAAFKDARRRDIDNFSSCPALKGIQDALVHAGVIPDDSTRYVRARTVEVITGADADYVTITLTGA